MKAATATSLRLLVADDDESNRETLRALLEDLPYPIDEAADSGTTLELLRTSPAPHVIVFDILLPKVTDGERVLRAMLDDDMLCGRHALVGITASPTQLTPTITDLLDELSAPLIVKPFDIDTLLDAVEAAIQRTQATRPDLW